MLNFFLQFSHLHHLLILGNVQFCHFFDDINNTSKINHIGAAIIHTQGTILPNETCCAHQMKTFWPCSIKISTQIHILYLGFVTTCKHCLQPTVCIFFRTKKRKLRCLVYLFYLNSTSSEFMHYQQKPIVQYHIHWNHVSSLKKIIKKIIAYKRSQLGPNQYPKNFESAKNYMLFFNIPTNREWCQKHPNQ